MNANELRIGNYVKSQNFDISRIVEISAIGSPSYVHYGIPDSEFGVWKDDPIEPIHLTTEWLERLGFVGRADFMWKGIVGIQIKEGKYYLALKDLGGVIFHSVVEIEFVHTLQNAWHLLTGTELTLKSEIK